MGVKCQQFGVFYYNDLDFLTENLLDNVMFFRIS